MDAAEPEPPVEPPVPTAAPGRRNFLTRVLSIVIGVVLGGVPVIVGLAALLDPLRAKVGKDQRPSGFPQGLCKVASRDALPDGVPQALKIVADRKDGWTIYRNEPIGEVYVRRVGDQVLVLSSECPHAGCRIDLAADGHEYRCPCHDSKFSLQGERSAGSPSARNMDELAVDEAHWKNAGEVWVKFQTFKTGTSDKIPTS